MANGDGQDAVYEITGQAPVSRYSGVGPPEDGIEVRFHIPALKVDGSVWVPGSVPDPEAARELIRQYVSGAYEVASLQN